MSLEAQARFTITAADHASKIVAGVNRQVGALGRTGRAASSMLDGFGNRYTALFSGAAAYGTISSVMGLEDRFVRLGIQANASAEKVNRLKDSIYAAARAPEIRLDPGEITSAVEEILEKTGDLKFAEDNIRNIGMAISATGAAGKDIGGIMAEFQKMGLVDPSQVLEALEILTVQGKEGAFTLQNLANLGPRVVTAYTAMGRTGVPAIREMGAALQMIRQGTGSAEMAATAFEALLRTLGDGAKVKKLQLAGIQVFDPEELKKGKEVLRPIHLLMADIVKRSGGAKTKLSEIFDAEAIRAFNSAATEFKQTGAIESLEKFYSVQANGKILFGDSATAANTASRSLQQLYIAWGEFADRNLSGPIQSLTKTLNSLSPETVDRWLKLGSGLALGLGGLVIANKVAQSASGLYGLLRGGRGAGGSGAGSLLGGGGGKPIPVFVVNNGGMPGGGAPGVPGTGKAGFAANRLLHAAAAGTAGYAVGTLINEGIGGVANMSSGGKYKGSGALGDWIYDLTHKDPQNMASRGVRRSEVGGTIRVQIDSEGRPKVKEIRRDKGDVNFDVDAGMTMAAAH